MTDPQDGKQPRGGTNRPVPDCELPATARVPSSHWLDASSTNCNTWDRGKQIPVSWRQVCEDLLQEALDDGGSDNITLIVGRTVKPVRA